MRKRSEDFKVFARRFRTDRESDRIKTGTVPVVTRKGGTEFKKEGFKGFRLG